MGNKIMRLRILLMAFVVLLVVAILTFWPTDFMRARFNWLTKYQDMLPEFYKRTPHKFTNTDSSALSKDLAYQAVVKIKSFVLDKDYDLARVGQGSGVIIDPQGLILTNYHVVMAEDDFDNSLRETGYHVCLTKDISREPECLYTANLISASKELDLALLQIQNISGLSNDNVYPFLNLNINDNTNINDEVWALDYPEIGAETITITKGIISGKNDKYQQKWIKTDAVVSFGNSGGAAIDSQGRVVGLTSVSHADLLSSLGYILNISSINQWVRENRSKISMPPSFLAKLEDLSKKINILRVSNKYINNYPYFSFNKPADWSFVIEDESGVLVTKKDATEAGELRLSLYRYPYIVSLENVIPNIKVEMAAQGALSFLNITKDKNIILNDLPAKDINISAGREVLKMYALPYQDYLIVLAYDYGKNNQDQKIIEDMINSLVVERQSAEVLEVKNYVSLVPPFTWELSGDWVIKKNNSQAVPLDILHKNYKEAYAQIKIHKLDANNQDFTNEQFLQNQNQEVETINKLGALLDLKVDIIDSQAHYKINEELTDGLRQILITKAPSSGKTLAYSASYYFRVSDKYVEISLDFYGADKKVFTTLQLEMEAMLKKLSFK